MTNPATTRQPTTRSGSARAQAELFCTPADRVTKSLLGYGVVAGPFYVLVTLTQAFTRQGFDLARHQWSLLANGGPGWVQIANFVLTGLMVIAFAVGLRRALAPGIGTRWAPRLIGVYGGSLIAAGVFRADPAAGFPVGTPEGPGLVSWHGLLHFATGGIGFSCLTIACLVMARRFSAEGHRTWAAFSRITGIVFVATFAMLASSGGLPVANILFTGAVVMVWTWLSAVAVNRYREVSSRARTQH